MYLKSLVNKIDKENPIISEKIPNPIDSKPSDKPKYIEVPNYLVKEGEMVGVIGSSEYVWKTGRFFGVINKKNKVFYMNDFELENSQSFKDEWKLITKTLENKYTDFDDTKKKRRKFTLG